MAIFDFEALHLRMNKACVQLIDGTPYCTLCWAQLPQKSQYVSHTSGRNHCSRSNHVYEELMRRFISPGIIMKSDRIVCILCDEDIGNRFDWKFRCHVDGYHHEKVVRKQSKELEILGFDTYYDDLDSLENYDEIFVTGVSQAGIYINSNDDLYCWLCDKQLPGWSQFSSHIKGSLHINAVVNQLKILADKAGLFLGIVLKDEYFQCKLCNLNLGADMNEVYSHLYDSNYYTKIHETKVHEQINDGLYEYYDSDNQDCDDGTSCDSSGNYDEYSHDDSTSYDYDSSGSYDEYSYDSSSSSDDYY